MSGRLEMRISEIALHIGCARPAVFCTYLMWINDDKASTWHWASTRCKRKGYRSLFCLIKLNRHKTMALLTARNNTSRSRIVLEFTVQRLQLDIGLYSIHHTYVPLMSKHHRQLRLVGPSSIVIDPLISGSLLSGRMDLNSSFNESMVVTG